MLFTNILLVMILFGIARLGHDLELIAKEQKKSHDLMCRDLARIANSVQKENK
jgi:hypothetical protein